MRETVEFRISEQNARRFLKPEDGKPLGRSTRKLLLDTNDTRYALVGRLEHEFMKQGSCFFTFWDIRRAYTKKELDAAELFHLRLRSAFEPEGEQCGTRYDESVACPHCGVGARQLNELRLEPGSLPRGKDITRTIAFSEIIVSSRLVEALREDGITGARFLPVLREDGRGALDSWYQLEVTSRPLGVAPVSRFGVSPFDPDTRGEYRCPLGHVGGLNLLSELSVRRADWDGSDLCVAAQWIGYRSRNGGAFRPYPLLLISQKLRRLLGGLKGKGFDLEVAHLV
ncbi:hypothetical protein JQX13_14755 [Archangium violaceum]|uniref:hypothetical protein n=1 Tax=Archangium violaceum TaxID=83451 RepID=UPI00193B67A9|nr:hypothetical protein [Archangium violaceum]QRK11217.1 hypothetical protein JQX13_14755 [Archangium violaceum]